MLLVLEPNCLGLKKEKRKIKKRMPIDGFDNQGENLQSSLIPRNNLEEGLIMINLEQGKLHLSVRHGIRHTTD